MSIKNPKYITVRALITNNSGQLLTCYYKKYRTYMTPGGHKDGEETDSEVLARELYEECGIKNVIVSNRIMSLYTPSDDTLNKYYFVAIDKIDLKHRDLEEGEIKDGLTVVWQDINEIIRSNTQEYYKSLVNSQGQPYIIKRELEFFKTILKENMI